MLRKSFNPFFRPEQTPDATQNEVQVNLSAKAKSVAASESDMATKPASKKPVTEMMRLLHTKTLILTEFPVSQVPDYAILSHRWLEYEVTYSDMFKLTDAMKQTDPYKKIVNCCKQVANVGLDCKCQ